jgi:hypothetical protein
MTRRDTGLDCGWFAGVQVGTGIDHVLNIASARTHAPARTAYARRVLTLLIIVVVLAAAGWAWVNRVRLLAKVLGQPESRIRAQIERRKR